jgi:hypothetical protein
MLSVEGHHVPGTCQAARLELSRQSARAIHGEGTTVRSANIAGSGLSWTWTLSEPKAEGDARTQDVDHASTGRRHPQIADLSGPGAFDDVAK